MPNMDPPVYIQERSLLFTFGIEKDGTIGFTCTPTPPVDYDFLSAKPPSNPVDKLYYEAFSRLNELAAQLIERNPK